MAASGFSLTDNKALAWLIWSLCSCSFDYKQRFGGSGRGLRGNDFPQALRNKT